MKYAVIKTGGKQYLVKENDEIIVDRVEQAANDAVEFDTLATFDDKGSLDMGSPMLSQKTKATVVAHMKGDKLRVAKFKAKVRYRKVRGFRPSLSRIKIVSV